MSTSTSLWNDTRHLDRDEELRFWELPREERREILLRMAGDLVDASVRDPVWGSQITKLLGAQSNLAPVDRAITTLSLISQFDSDLADVEIQDVSRAAYASAIGLTAIWASVPYTILHSVDASLTAEAWGLVSNIALLICSIFGLVLAFGRRTRRDMEEKRFRRTVWATELLQKLMRDFE